MKIPQETNEHSLKEKHQASLNQLGVDTVLNTMSIVQSRTMYDVLKKIFGG